MTRYQTVVSCLSRSIFSQKNRVESPLFEELYPTYNLYNHNSSRISTEVVMTTQDLSVHIPNIQLYHNYPWTPSYSAPPQYIPLFGSIHSHLNLKYESKTLNYNPLGVRSRTSYHNYIPDYLYNSPKKFNYNSFI